ncbi:MAG: circularly permuted type 2 ATP-grasp protein [Firmicutes bacterium]|nr:circularly permuted type 2 ATP-grasp protein [Bacillota bacterium]
MDYRTTSALDLFKAFEQQVMADPKAFYQDYLTVKNHVENSTAIYMGKPVDFIYQPMFFSQDDIARFQQLTDTLTGILRKVIAQYRKSPDFRRLFGFSPLAEELILLDPGYRYSFPVARFDVFYSYDGSFQFCELNADGSSGMNEISVLHDIFWSAKALAGFLEQYHLVDFELFNSWVDSMLEIYQEFAGSSAGKPNIAIVDFDREGTISEFQVFQNYFRARGYQTVICDPRDFKYRSGQLSVRGMKIDLVYRRATTARIIEEAEEIQDFLQAYRDGAVCVVGGFVSQIIHNKMIFAVLHSKECQALLTQEEIAFIKAHVPETLVIDDDGSNLRRRIIDDKDSWVLKPLDLYAGQGVFIGKNHSQSEWQEIVAGIAPQTYLVQEFCQVPQLRMATVEKDGFRFEPYNYLIGLFMYKEKFSGIFTRAGRKALIATGGESVSLPTFVLGGAAGTGR